MDIITRTITDSDREECIYVEKGAMPHNRYINDVWNMFLYETDGDLIGAFVDGKLQGMGKLTRLYQDYGWLETLRVHPDFQNMGIGQKIYDAYFEHIAKLNLKSVGMYTEMYNKISKHLAEKNGFEVKSEYTEILKPIRNINTNPTQFKLVSKENGEEFLSQYYDYMDDYLVINRTFYPVDKGLGEFLASKNWVYTDDKENVLIGGYRFQPEKAFHIPFIKGDIDKILDFANYLGCKAGSKNLSMLKPVNSTLIDLYVRKGFSIDDNYMTLWIDL